MFFLTSFIDKPDMAMGPFSVTQPNPTHDLYSHSWPNQTQPNIEQQHNVVQIGYINQKPISK